MDSPRSQAGRSTDGGAVGSPKTLRATDATGLRGAIRRTSTFLRRRRVAFAIVLGALVFTDLLVTVSCPSTYRATATVTVEAARLPEDVKPLVPSVQERLGRLTGLATSDQHLSELAKVCPRLAQARVLRVFEGGAASPVQAVREAIVVEMRGQHLASGERTELVLISVTGERAEETAYVASAIAARLVRLDREFRLETASAIHSSVLAETTADSRPVEELKARIDRLRAENPLMATTSDSAIRAQLEQDGRALDEDQIAQVELATSLPLLENEMAHWAVAVREEAEVARRTAAAAEASRGTGPAHPTADDPRRAHLRDLEKQLLQARSHWTEQNPEVKRLIRELALEREYLGEPAEPDADETPAPPSTPPRSSRAPTDRVDPREPAGKNDEVRPVADTPGVQVQAESRFVLEAPAYRNWRESVAKAEAARTRDSALKARIQKRASDVARLRELVDKLPEKRLELTKLEAERDRLQGHAKEVQERLARVEHAWRIEMLENRASACTERLALAGPVGPEFELGPDRLLVFFVGLLIAFPVAALAAYVRDVQDRSLHTDDEVAQALDLPVLGVIPRLRGRR